MKRKRTIQMAMIPAALLLTGCAVREQPIRSSPTVYTETYVEKPDNEEPEKTADNTEPKPEPDKDPHKKTELRSPYAITIESPTLLDRLVSQVNQEKLKEYEGSYTMEQLRSSDDPGYTLPFKSTWLPGGRSLPQTRLRVKYNPVTDSYDLTGGDLDLPVEDWSLSYEKDPTDEQSQTYLIWKKDF